MPFGDSIYKSCTGLAEGTFVAVLSGGQWQSAARGREVVHADGRRARQPEQHPAVAGTRLAATSAQAQVRRTHVPTTTRYLSQAHGSFLLTTILDPDCDSSVYYTGLPLSGLHDKLRDVALAEAAVFAVVLLLAGVLGTFWVRFSLRPLRRVATTASQVTELPLESGEVSLPAGVPDTDPATETGQVGIAFNRMLGHVETALRRRAASESRLRRFAADASHELRTPLAAIRGYAELALRHPGDSPEDGDARPRPGAFRVHPDERARRRPAAARPARRRAAAEQRARRHDAAGHRRHERRPGGAPRPPVGARTARRPGACPRRRAPAAAGARQPAVQRRAAHPGRHHGHRAGQRRAARRRARQRCRVGLARDAAARAPAGGLGDRRRPRHPRRAAARPVRAVHQGRQVPLARHQRLLDGARARDRRRRGHRPSRRGAGDQPARHDPLHDRARPARGDVRAGAAARRGRAGR